jgi:hypothetical protein
MGRGARVVPKSRAANIRYCEPLWLNHARRELPDHPPEPVTGLAESEAR